MDRVTIECIIKSQGYRPYFRDKTTKSGVTSTHVQVWRGHAQRNLGVLSEVEQLDEESLRQRIKASWLR